MLGMEVRGQSVCGRGRCDGLGSRYPVSGSLFAFLIYCGPPPLLRNTCTFPLPSPPLLLSPFPTKINPPGMPAFRGRPSTQFPGCPSGRFLKTHSPLVTFWPQGEPRAYIHTDAELWSHNTIKLQFSKVHHVSSGKIDTDGQMHTNSLQLSEGGFGSRSQMKLESLVSQNSFINTQTHVQQPVQLTPTFLQPLKTRKRASARIWSRIMLIQRWTNIDFTTVESVDQHWVKKSLYGA